MTNLESATTTNNGTDEWYFFENPCLYKPCQKGHTFVFADGSTSGEIPEGLPCECGTVKAHYEYCLTCGRKGLKII